MVPTIFFMENWRKLSQNYYQILLLKSPLAIALKGGSNLAGYLNDFSYISYVNCKVSTLNIFHGKACSENILQFISAKYKDA